MDGWRDDLLFALPLAVVGVLLVGLGWRGAAQHLRTTSGPWWTRLRSSALLLPGAGALVLAMAVLVALGMIALELGLLYTAGAAGVVAGVVSAVRAHRAGQRRRALWSAAWSSVGLVMLLAVALGWTAVFDAVFGLLAVFLLVLSVRTSARRWRAASAAQRRGLLQSVFLGLGLVSQAVSRVLHPPHQTAGMVVDVFGGACLVVSLGFLLDARRRRPRTNVRPSPHDGGPGVP